MARILRFRPKAFEAAPEMLSEEEIRTSLEEVYRSSSTPCGL